MATARVISTEKFVVEVINGRERGMSQVSDEKIEWVPRARSLLSYVFKVRAYPLPRIAIVLRPRVRSPCESNFPRVPARSKGLVEGRLVFVIVTPSAVFATGGIELIVTRLDGLSDVLSELANGYVRVESGSVVHDGVSIALMWHSTTP